MKVTNKSLETLELAQKVSKVGNKMLSSDFKICAFYAFASVEASIVNVKINLDSIQDEKYQKNIKLECLKIHNKAELVRQEILKDEIV